MKKLSKNEISAGFIKHAIAWDEAESEAFFGFFAALDNLVMREPLKALEVMDLICRQSNNPKVLSNLGAGSIQDWLMLRADVELDYYNAHKGSYFAQLIKIANRNKNFRMALKETWSVGLPEDEWAFILKASGRSK